MRYDTSTQTLIIPLMLRVRVSFVQLEIVTRNTPINVATLGGKSENIDGKNLQFDYGKVRQKCTIEVLDQGVGRISVFR